MESVANLIKQINAISSRYAPWQIYTDFLEAAAIAISNAVDKSKWEQREQRYLEIVKKYKPEDFEAFPGLLAELTEIMERSVQQGEYPDYMGHLFHEMGFHNKQKGQFFTPQPVSDMMALMSVGKVEEKLLEEKGYISAYDCAAGSGSMLLGVAKAMLTQGYNPTQQLLVIAEDIDTRCVHMAYIQLSLYGIPAIVVNCNSLTREEYDRFYTPAYIWGGWYRRWAKEKPRLTDKIKPTRQPKAAKKKPPEPATVGEQLVLF